MVSAVGIAANGTGPPRPSCAPSAGSSVSALQGQIRQAQIQLNDWTTCVSAKTPKGQAAIRKLSGEISAAKEQIVRALQAQSSAPLPAFAAATFNAQNVKPGSDLAVSTPRRPGSIDVWA
jgi:hypothetical protein